ncbi:MAG: serine protease [Planctomycetota bacterium]|nr:serine protease [Planctomycetota bacterium]
MAASRSVAGTWLILVVCLLFVHGSPAPAADPVDLEDAVARQHSLPADGGIWTGRIRVPEDATALAVAVCSERNVDLYLRRAGALTKSRLSEADVSSRNAGVLETVRLASDEAVPLESGTWHIAVAPDGNADRGASFEIAAFVDRGRGTPTVLPGETVEREIPVHRDRPELRTFLPTLVRSLTLRLDGAARPGVRYRLDGPREYRRSGAAPRSIVLQRADSPAGAYTLDLRASGSAPLPATIKVRTSWSANGDDKIRLPMPVVRPGGSTTLTLGGTDGPTARTVRIPVPAGIGGIEIDATNPSRADVDLYVRRGGPLQAGDEDADYFALSSAPFEALYLGGVTGLAAGTYYCEVVLVESKGRVPVTLSIRSHPKGIGRGTWGDGEPPRLEFGKWTRGRVEAGRAGVTWYDVVIPAGTRSMHAMLLGSSAPLDLVLARKTDGSIMRRALSARVDERIDHTFTVPPDGPRLFVLGVMNRSALEKVVDFRVALSLNRAPPLPPDLVWPPLINWQGRSATVRAAASTVELTVRDNAGGSGTCVTPRGRILTCRHVLEIEGQKGRIQREGVLVAFPARLDEPPVQSFLARVTAEDRKKDLALLEITSDVFGRPLPEDLTLPWVPLGDSSTLELGDPVQVFGYPSEGSERSRTPVILTRGSIAGLEAVGGAPRWIKTDAWIGLGHSGGSMVDARMRLVGIPAATLGQSEVLGLAVPVSLLPAAWKLMILKDQPR